jgi:Zn-dependent peptidase ImmA (M78 family)
VGSILSQLINYAEEHNISIQMQPLKPHTKPKCNTELSMIIINSTWWNPREIYFQIAHEMSHIINGDEGVYYYSTDRSAQICEGDANRTALHIIVPMYFEDIDPDQANVHQFMTDLQIPVWLEHEATEIISEYYAA